MGLFLKETIDDDDDIWPRILLTRSLNDHDFVSRWLKAYVRILNRFYRVHARDRRTDGQTDLNALATVAA